MAVEFKYTILIHLSKTIFSCAYFLSYMFLVYFKLLHTYTYKLKLPELCAILNCSVTAICF